jgi:peptidoglycan/xylan/chitin deacetylase (PgdA/CDA1 family)
MWDRAWVNRIALFLRRWAAHDQQADEQALFGDLPKASIHLSHDVDAVSKTPAIRLKQTAFHLLNAAKDIASGRAPSLGKALRFLVGKGSYDCFSTIAELEKQHGFTSQFNVYAGKTGWHRSLKQRLMDPSYSVDEQWLQDELRSLLSSGHRIGLHQSFDSWTNPEVMRRERKHLEAAINTPVVGCRQHWLRFSWQTTWRAQEESGLQLDGTLGFNDRPGFRNGAALSFHPWDEQAGKPLSLKAIPLLFMDSHFYDYTKMSAKERQTQMKRWVDEVLDVQGEATIIWHQRVFSPDYGWGSGYRELLSLLARC